MLSHDAPMGQWGTNINVVVSRRDLGLFHAQGRCPMLSHAAPSGPGLSHGAPMGQWGLMSWVSTGWGWEWGRWLLM